MAAEEVRTDPEHGLIDPDEPHCPPTTEAISGCPKRNGWRGTPDSPPPRQIERNWCACRHLAGGRRLDSERDAAARGISRAAEARAGVFSRTVLVEIRSLLVVARGFGKPSSWLSLQAITLWLSLLGWRLPFLLTLNDPPIGRVT